MTRGLLACIVACCAQAVSAQIPTCTECVLGIYDDKARTRTEGAATGPAKDVYVGVDLSAGFASFGAVSFSIAGLEGFVVGYEILSERFTYTGEILEYHRGGGITISWDVADCQPPHTTVMRVSLTNLGAAWPADRELQIRVSLPVGNPLLDRPYVTLCDQPTFTNMFPTPGVYVLNRTTAVEPATWSALRTLYE